MTERGNPRTALITGVTGQDGSYLAEWLLNQGTRVHGIGGQRRRLSAALSGKLSSYRVQDLTKPEDLAPIVAEVLPDEVYHLGAHHFSSQGVETVRQDLRPFLEVNLLAAESLLEAMRVHCPKGRFFYAASAHIFGDPVEAPQTEQTPMRPETPYAISKCAGRHLCHHYRKTHAMFASVGILYNHESPRRPASFVTTQIAQTAARAALGQESQLQVRDLSAQVDWGAAVDYVRAMWLALQRDVPDDYVIASGQTRTVAEFVKQAFAAVGLDPGNRVRQGPARAEARRLPYVGDSFNVRSTCGWEPHVSFEMLVSGMVQRQIELLRMPGA